MEVCIVGTGRLGASLAILLGRAGHTVGVRARGGAWPPGVVLLAVPDRALAEVAREVPPGRVVLHCSGTTPVDVLRPNAPAGSFHPLMTFPGPDALPDLSGVPAALAGDPEAVDVARILARSLGMEPLEVPGDRRLYHAAAVIAGNYATVLLAEASRVLAAAGVPPERAPAVLAPLALQSIRNAVLMGPAASLTGPAARGDAPTLAGHRDALLSAGLSELVPLTDALAERARILAARGD